MEFTKKSRIVFIRRVQNVSAEINVVRQPQGSIEHQVRCTIEGSEKEYSYFYTPISSVVASDDSIYNFPFLLHRDGQPWHEANMYLWSLASDYNKISEAIDGIVNTAVCLLEYLVFCESQKINYLDFSGRRANHRPSYKYFNHLVEENRLGAGAINEKTGKIYYFFDWLFKQSGYENEIDRVDFAQSYTFYFKSGTGSGSKETKKRSQTLSYSKETIPIEKGMVRDEGEDLRPLTTSERKELIGIIGRKEFTVEERLIAQLALYTGIRKQTILTLRMKHLKLFKDEALRADGTYQITAGPRTGIDTKFDRKYSFYVEKQLAEELIIYANSPVAKNRRKAFQAKYRVEHSDLSMISDDDMYVFLSEEGNCHYMAKNDPRYKVTHPYARPKGKRTDVLIKKIKKYSSESFPSDFTFHWLRATFALRYYTVLVSVEDALVKSGRQDRPRRFDEILRDVMLRLCHKNTAVTQSYLNLFQNFDERQEAQNAYEVHVFMDLEHEFSGTDSNKEDF